MLDIILNKGNNNNKKKASETCKMKLIDLEIYFFMIIIKCDYFLFSLI